VSTARESYELAKAAGLLGRWIIAGTPVSSRYPCRCRVGRECSPLWCQCSGRVDLVDAPERCCSRYNTPAVAAAAHAARDSR
jgi:hypothetical protein